jgi:hypothetical protein
MEEPEIQRYAQKNPSSDDVSPHHFAAQQVLKARAHSNQSLRFPAKRPASEFHPRRQGRVSLPDANMTFLMLGEDDFLGISRVASPKSLDPRCDRFPVRQRAGHRYSPSPG